VEVVAVVVPVVKADLVGQEVLEAEVHLPYSLTITEQAEISLIVFLIPDLGVQVEQAVLAAQVVPVVPVVLADPVMIAERIVQVVLEEQEEQAV